ncbi:hypothetical protein [Hymenobacter sp. BT188]|uniref:hypothetical protein n=1 Tax=Hymenobacter sp. BT188 TaxID=2763504 RepID=UPI001651ADFA|nr:hypothetical protein [Hymenobacter sp. BT188]
MIIRSIPHFCLQYDQVLSVLRLEWISGPDMSELHTSSQHLLGLIRTLSVRHLLLDMNTVPDLSLADQVWLGDHWMPELVTLTLERLVLVIDSFRVHNQLAIDALHDLVQPGIRFDAQYFPDSISAMDWLTDGSGRLPTLAAEWDARHGNAPQLVRSSWLPLTVTH